MFIGPVLDPGFPHYKANWHLQLPFTPSQDASPSHGSPSPGSFWVSMCTPRGEMTMWTKFLTLDKPGGTDFQVKTSK